MCNSPQGVGASHTAVPTPVRVVYVYAVSIGVFYSQFSNGFYYY